MFFEVKMNRRLHTESLESRCLMAGNVTASIVGGELRVVGDSAANWVEVREVAGVDGTGKTFVIEGKEFNGIFDAEGEPVNGTLPTRVNGGFQDVFLTTPLDKVRIVLGGGNDAVDLGDGDTPSTAAGIVVDTGDGRDYAKLEAITMYGTDAPLVVRTGPAAELGGDTLDLDTVTVTAQSLSAQTGGGNDRVFAELVSVAGTTNFNLGDGADFFDGDSLDLNATTINGGLSAHRDVITLADSDFLSLNAVLSAGNDLLELRERVNVTNRLIANGGEGTDELRIGQLVTIGQLSRVGIERNT